MKRILIALAGGILLGTIAAPYAKLPPPTEEEKAAAAAKKEKDAAEKAKAAKDLSAAQDRAVANYKKNKGEKGATAAGATAQPKSQPEAASAGATQSGATKPGAGHDEAVSPSRDLTRKEAQTEMPTPAQANDHSSTARETVPSGR